MTSPVRTARATAAALGLDSARLGSVKAGHWLSFQVGDCWVRSGGEELASLATYELAAAAALGGLTAQARSAVRPFTLDGERRVAVLWERLVSVRQATWDDVADCCAQLASTPATGALAGFNPAGEIAVWCDQGWAAAVITSDVGEALTTRAAAAQQALAELHPAMLHGDAHLGNIIVTAEGARLIDLETVCVGPAIYDMAPMLCEAQRFGADPTAVKAAMKRWRDRSGHTQDGIGSALALYEIWATAWCVKHSITNAAGRDETAIRLSGLLQASEQRWTRQ